MAITLNRLRAANFIDRVQLPLARLVSDLFHWNETRRTRVALSQLSDHELADIGLSRGDIDQIG